MADRTPNQTDPLSASELRVVVDPGAYAFETTAEVEPLAEAIGQERALDALRFGVGIRREGYNLFVLGPPGTGRHETVMQTLQRAVAPRPAPSDWCYVNNFKEPHKPRAIRLPKGLGVTFRDDMKGLVEELRAAIPAALQSEDYQTRKRALAEELNERRAAAFERHAEHAKEKGFDLLQTPTGMVLVPVRDGEVIDKEDFLKLPEEEQARIKEDIEQLQEELRTTIREIPQLERELRVRERELEHEVISFAVDHLMQELRQRYGEHAPVREYLDEVQADLIEHADDFRPPEGLAGAGPFGFMLTQQQPDEHSLVRYSVNLVIDHSDSECAPVVYEDRPSVHRLTGRCEHLPQLGALVTNFTLIKPGALHRATGGFLVLDALKVLLQPLAWQNLKRSLQSKEIQIESLAEQLSLVSTVSLEPEPIPLDVKVVLIGERSLYYVLAEIDPEFSELVKVVVDFDDRTDRTPESTGHFARLVSTLVQQESLRHLDAPAVARTVEHMSRLAGDAEKLSTATGRLFDLLREADYWAEESGRDVVSAEDVSRAVDGQVQRADRVRDRVQEAIGRGTLLIDVEGRQVGQVNALSVISMGGFTFGMPNRVTSRARMGKSELVDVEREVELGGPTHSKGVLILSGFVRGRYMSDRPLSLSASLVFEQSYSRVEGDSASLAELCALLSAVADIAIEQRFAVTGSVNQHGRVQAIGGVNEKIEGFFDTCRKRGLAGDQAVLIPASNVKHLMLRQDVVEAVEGGTFGVYPVETVDQALELLTGVNAGERGADGQYPEGTFNHRVEHRLREFSEQAREFAGGRAQDSRTRGPEENGS